VETDAPIECMLSMAARHSLETERIFPSSRSVEKPNTDSSAWRCNRAMRGGGGADATAAVAAAPRLWSSCEFCPAVERPLRRGCTRLVADSPGSPPPAVAAESEARLLAGRFSPAADMARRRMEKGMESETNN
jgi:hypothetical protein